MMRVLPALKYPSVLMYSILSSLHWQERETALRECLTVIKQAGRASRSRRLVDVGCGPGLLVPLATELGYRYLGIDSDSRTIDYCAEAFAHTHDVEFAAGSAEALASGLSSDDVVVLNGVLHHLSDVAVEALMPRLARCHAVVVADHWRQPGSTRGLVRWAQELDRGKFVRDYEYFERFGGGPPRHSSVFPIGVLGIVVWTYFCNVYDPPLISGSTQLHCAPASSPVRASHQE